MFLIVLLLQVFATLHNVEAVLPLKAWAKEHQQQNLAADASSPAVRIIPPSEGALDDTQFSALEVQSGWRFGHQAKYNPEHLGRWRFGSGSWRHELFYDFHCEGTIHSM